MVEFLEGLFLWPVRASERIPWKPVRFLWAIATMPLMLACFAVVMLPLALAYLWESV